jgi:hypothetical protein
MGQWKHPRRKCLGMPVLISYPIFLIAEAAWLAPHVRYWEKQRPVWLRKSSIHSLMWRLLLYVYNCDLLYLRSMRPTNLWKRCVVCLILSYYLICLSEINEMRPSFGISASEIFHQMSLEVNASGLAYDCNSSDLCQARIEFVQIVL